MLAKYRFLVLTSLFAGASIVGCTLITEVDRSLIDDEPSGGGQGGAPADGGSPGGGGTPATGGLGGMGGVAPTGGLGGMGGA